MARAAAFGRIEPSMLAGAAYLLVFALVFFPLALFLMRRRLIK